MKRFIEGEDLFQDAVVAIDGSKFKAVNGSDRNFIDAKLKRRMADIESNISRYLAELDTADRQEPGSAQSKSIRLNDKIAALKIQMATPKEMEAKLAETGETQMSLTDLDSRSRWMMTRGPGIVGYNVQTAVDAKHHLIVEREVTSNGSDRDPAMRRASARWYNRRKPLGRRLTVGSTRPISFTTGKRMSTAARQRNL